MTDQIEELEHAMLKLPQATCNVRHIFAPGLYVRELSMPAGTVAIGHRQKQQHLNVLLAGRVNVINPDGTTSELRAPLTFVGEPGRKVGYVLEDVVWMNIYPTTETDVGKLEETYLEKSEVFRQQVPAVLLTPADFPAVLEQLRLTAEQVQEESERPTDLAPFPPGAYKVKVGPSQIQGQGLIATADIEPGEIICPALWQGMRTPAGRYTNHASDPNAHPWAAPDGAVYWVAHRAISGCRGGQDGEEVTIDYRAAVAVKHQVQS